MEQVCPLCNGLTDAGIPCKNCGAAMVDDGMLSDYAGPYAPYELAAHVKQENEGRCTHLLHCPKCGKESYAIVQSDII
jgi:Zn finger protein HypA/HybF involved in hydrogenase expression